MTNNEYLNSVTGESDTSEIASVKMLLAAIDEDWEKGRYVMNRGTYLRRYKAQKEWLDSEADVKLREDGDNNDNNHTEKRLLH